MHARPREDCPKSDPEIRTWVPQVYLGDDFNKHKRGAKGVTQGTEVIKKSSTEQVTSCIPRAQSFWEYTPRIIPLSDEENKVIYPLTPVPSLAAACPWLFE